MTNQNKNYHQKKPLNAYGYARVSTEDQAREGLSLEAQQAKIEAFAQIHGLNLIEIFIDDGYSGKNLDRPGIQKLLSLTTNQDVEAVIVYKLDRLSRKTKDLLILIENTFHQGNTRFFSISEQIDTKTAMGKFFLTMMGALAQMERELIAERTKDTLDYKKQQGEYLGQVPYGFQLSSKGKLVRNQKEYNVIRQMRRLKQQGKSYREIARVLNQKGIPSKREGSKWFHGTISSILK